MTVESWMRIDREELIAACEGMISAGGGLLIVVGDDSSGRSEAARIVASSFADAGLQTHRVLDAGDRPSSFRYLLEDIAGWALVKLEQTGPGLSMSASNASVSIERMSGYCIQTLQTLKNSASALLAFIVSAFEQDTSFGPADVRHMVRLVESVGGCWVVLSRSTKLWERVQCEKLKLDNFTRPEVANALRGVIEENGGDVSHMPDYLDRIFGTGITSVTPLQAYQHLQQASTAPSGRYWQL
jgi:hypothetical protein